MKLFSRKSSQFLVSTCPAMATNSSSQLVANKPPPPPPHGWSGVCKTVAYPIDKKDEGGDSDALPVRIINEVRSKKADADAEKKKKSEKKERQKAARAAKKNPNGDGGMEVDSEGDATGPTAATTVTTPPAASATTGSTASGGKFPGLSRGGTPGAVADGGFDEMVAEGQTIKSTFSCKGDECPKPDLPCSKLMLAFTGDWCGDVATYCKVCWKWEGDDKSFEKACKGLWIKRAREKFDKNARVRAIRFDKLEAYYLEKLPGSSNEERRKCAVMHLTLIGTAIGNDIAKTSEHNKAAVQMVYEEWSATVSAEAKNSFVLTEHRGWSLSAQDGAYLTRVTENCTISFICRDCGYYGPDWGKARDHYWFRCFACGARYHPWTCSPEKSPYNRVVIVHDPILDTLTYTPAMWPDTAEDNWLTNMCEVYARQITTVEDLNDFVKRSAVGITKLLTNAGNPTQYQQMAFPEAAQWRFGGQWDLSQFQTVVERGFVGGIWKPADPTKVGQIFTDWAELAQLVGNITAASRIINSKL